MDRKGLGQPVGVVFDWDNTLADTWPAIAEALNAVRVRNGFAAWTTDEARVHSARSLRESFPEWFGSGWQAARDAFYAHIEAVHIKRLEAKDGAQELLVALEARGVPMVVVSTKKNVLLNKEIDHLGWRRYFKAVVGSLDCPRDKPDRMPVDLALASVGLAGDRMDIWFVGDTHADVECALRSGVMPVLIGSAEQAARLAVRAFFPDCLAAVRWLEKYERWEH